MKKVIARLLAVLLTVVCFLPAFSAAATQDGVPIRDTGTHPVVMLSGDGEAIYDADGNRLFKFSDLLSMVSGDGADSNALLGSVAAILKPFMLQGLLKDDWDPFYEALQTTISGMTGARIRWKRHTSCTPIWSRCAV